MNIVFVIIIGLYLLVGCLLAWACFGNEFKQLASEHGAGVTFLGDVLLIIFWPMFVIFGVAKYIKKYK